LTNLVLSVNYFTGLPTNFARLAPMRRGESPLLIGRGVSGLEDEVKLAVVKTTTNGFTAGDMFFSVATASAGCPPMAVHRT